MPVVDASVLVAYLAGGEGADVARDRLLGDEGVWAPHLVDAEVGHVVRRAVRVGELDAARGGEVLRDLADLRLLRVSHTGLLQRAWSLRANMSFYEALYVALAERLDLPLLTLDRRLTRAPGVAITIEVLG